VREPLSSPFTQETIVVQSLGMERWISMEIASHNAISANCYFPFPNKFLQDIFAKIIPDLPDYSPFESAVMTFKIMKIQTSLNCFSLQKKLPIHLNSILYFGPR